MTLKDFLMSQGKNRPARYEHMNVEQPEDKDREVPRSQYTSGSWALFELSQPKM